MKKPTVRDCAGCYNDFYNHSRMGGNEATGRPECWSLRTAEFVKRIEVHIDQPPPYKQKPIKVPSCFRRQRYVYLDPASKK